jgi:hypothetical protein
MHACVLKPHTRAYMVGCTLSGHARTALDSASAVHADILRPAKQCTSASVRQAPGRQRHAQHVPQSMGRCARNETAQRHRWALAPLLRRDIALRYHNGPDLDGMSGSARMLVTLISSPPQSRSTPCRPVAQAQKKPGFVAGIRDRRVVTQHVGALNPG